MKCSQWWIGIFFLFDFRKVFIFNDFLEWGNWETKSVGYFLHSKNIKVVILKVLLYQIWVGRMPKLFCWSATLLFVNICTKTPKLILSDLRRTHRSDDGLLSHSPKNCLAIALTLIILISLFLLFSADEWQLMNESW